MSLAPNADMNLIREKVNTKLDWCSYDAAKYACQKWHYSRCIPAGKLAKIGVWENDIFIGAIIYGRGATSALVKQYGLKMNEGCELVRIALNNHKTEVSRLIAISIKLLKRQFPGLHLIVSFADPDQGHYGGVYQASGWVFTGNSNPADEYIYKGRRFHGRSFRSLYKGMENDTRVTKIKGSSKHRYLMPLNKEIRNKIIALSKPYPKRTKKQDSESPSGLSGAVPTCTLQY